MDSQEIATGILSLTLPSVVGWDKSERREMARRVNEYTADLVAKRPDRFGNFATLPIPDKAFAGSGRILFGSDFPYAPAAVGASFTAKPDADDGLTAEEHRAISHVNAWTLFPRLAPQHVAASAEPHSARSGVSAIV